MQKTELTATLTRCRCHTTQELNTVQFNGFVHHSRWHHFPSGQPTPTNRQHQASQQWTEVMVPIVMLGMMRKTDVMKLPAVNCWTIWATSFAQPAFDFQSCKLQSLDVTSAPGPSQKLSMEVEYSMDLPPPSSYSDVHGGPKVPSLPMTRIVQYLDTHDKKFEEKFKAMMYEQRQVLVAGQ